MSKHIKQYFTINILIVFAIHEYEHQMRKKSLQKKARQHKITLEVLSVQDHWKIQMIISRT